MSIFDYFRPVSTRSAQEVRVLLDEHSPEEYTLVDVRQAKEYAGGHLPGAKLIPMDELEERQSELDPAKPTITYCSAGVRSRSAAAILANAGFREVYSMKGGIREWEGLVAEGAPESDLTWFAAAGSPEEYLALAWYLEEGTRRFYVEVSEELRDREAAGLFRELAVAEVRHKEMLVALYEGFAGKPAGSGFPEGVAQRPAKQYMEGGMRVQEALEWTRGRHVRDILELAIGLEAVAYDRYLILRRELGDENSRRVFEVLSDEERRHLQKLTRLFDHFI
jgi:rhodanese-related sulfurtransferase/rubrerythrin